MKRILFLLLLVSLLPVSLTAAGTPGQYPYALITSSQGSSIRLVAEPNEQSFLYQNATLHIFASTGTNYSVYIDSQLYTQNTTHSAHTEVQLHLSASQHTITVHIAENTFTFTVLVTRYTITQGAVQQLTQMLSIPPWKWTLQQWYVFADTLFGAILAVPMAIVVARYLIIRKWGGANVIS